MDPMYGVSWWNSFGTWVTAIATATLVIVTYLQVRVTRLISTEVKNASQIRERQANSRYVNEQWQRLNIHTALNKDFLRAAQAVYESEVDDGIISKRGVIFYILNILYDMYNAQDDYIDSDFRNHMTYDHVEILLKTSREDLNIILENHRGYTPDFRDYINEYISNVDLKSRNPVSSMRARKSNTGSYVFGDL